MQLEDMRNERKMINNENLHVTYNKKEKFLRF